jgi:hypothetical protein
LEKFDPVRFSEIARVLLICPIVPGPGRRISEQPSSVRRRNTASGAKACSHVWQAPYLSNKICEQGRGIVPSPRQQPRRGVLILEWARRGPDGTKSDTFARYKGEAENALLAAGFPHVDLFRPAYIYPVEPRKEPNFSYRLLRAIYPALQLLFPNQVIRADDLARAMVDVAIQGTDLGAKVFENRDIRAMVKRIHPSTGKRSASVAGTK